MLPLGIIRADAAKAAHIDEKDARGAMKELAWREIDAHHFVADAPGGTYVLRRVESNSRIRSQKFRWKALWVPSDSPHVRQLALEKVKGWSKGAAEVHYARSQR